MFNEALDDIQKAIDELYGGREVSLQQLSATFRRGDFIEILQGNGSIMPTVLTSLTQAVRLAGLYNPEAEVAPACILWPDGEGQWTSILPHLLDEMPELIVLGKYDPAQRRGPAIWLRCVIAGVIDDTRLPEQRTPIIYLPGVSRQQLRDVENCPDALAPLVELQFRGTYWSQANGRDWTVLAFLKSRQGVDLDVAQDNDSKQAMLAALGHLLNEELSYLKSMRLDKHFFNLLIAGGDPARELLKWLDEEESFRATRTDDQWRAFVDLCQSQWGFNPETEGPIGAATKLASREGPWNAIWDRFREAPSRYPGIPVRIRSAEPPRSTILWLTDDDGRFDGWPQWNDEQEEALRQALLGLETKTREEVRTQLLELERQHGRRRQAVWAQLGDAALAQALEPLSELAAITQIGLDAGTIDDLVTGYANTGWKADDAVLRALAFAHMPQDIEAVTAAIRGVYLPWVDDAAHYLQRITEEQGYPGGTIAHAPAIEPTPGECILFVDGLRFDAAKRLVKMLELAGLTVTEDMAWAALPSITSTAKPAVSPVRHAIRGDHANTEFVPQVGQTGQSLTTYHFRRLLSEAGWQVPGSSEHGDCEGSAWFEFGNIDEAGHHRQIRLAGALDELLYDIGERIKALLSAGWKGIRVVTDHGWLLMPGGLPKVELPSAQTENKWGRFAMLKPGAPSNVRLFPWYWNPDRLVAIADGVRAFRQGMIYTHGGLSLQECLTLQLRVTSATGTLAGTPFRIASVTWQGLRCRIVADGRTSGVSVDIRLQPGNPSSSVVATVRALRDDGTGSVVVDDDGLIGETATVVFIAEDGRLVAQTITTIGGDGP